MRATIQFCTYNRAHLLGRVLDACFEQTVPDDAYEVVLVDDGSTKDNTAEVIAQAERRATCRFVVVSQANAGLARARNAGIARASGERIIFIDDDVLPVPSFVAEHLRSHDAHPAAVVRGGAIETPSFDRLPTPTWTLANYSANWFWTTNVSAPLGAIRAAGGFTESFREYGWEDIELGLRLRAAGVEGVFNPKALAFHYKPPPTGAAVAGMVRQARAQGRTAAQLRDLHDTWRVRLATGEDPLRLVAHRLLRAGGWPKFLERVVGDVAPGAELRGAKLAAARALAGEAYFEALDDAVLQRPAAT